MNLRQDKKIHAYLDVKNFFELDSPALIGDYPVLVPAIAEFNLRYDELWKRIVIIQTPLQGITARRKEIRLECQVSIIKLLAAMQYHYKLINDTEKLDMASMSESALRLLTVGNFFIFCQTVMDHYVPATFTPLGVVEAEMDALKLKLKEYPEVMQRAANGRVKRKTAVTELKTLQREMDDFLRYKVQTIMTLVDDKYEKEKLQYFKAIRIGIPNITTGPPHKKGKAAPKEIVVLNKAPYRKKLAIIVNNNGQTPLLAGRSSNQTEIQGTPFIIEPGKIRKRISLKLGSKGQFILLQNVGEGEGSFKVWLKE